MNRNTANSSPKRSEVYEVLRRSIVTGQIGPGQIMNEAALAAKYGVSKTPVREALTMLAFEEWVTSLPRTGYVVTEISMRDIQESYHLRTLLEVEAAALAAGRITADQINQLEKLRPFRPEDVDLNSKSRARIMERF